MTYSYNRIVRKVCLALMMLSLAACNRGTENKEEVKQAVIDHLATRGFAVKPTPEMPKPSMTVDITSVTFNGEHAEAVAAISVPGGPAGSAMSIPYKLDRQNGKWVVNAPAGGHPGAATPPEGINPHGSGGPENPHGGMAPSGGGSSVPSPDSLPPVKKK